MFRLRTNSGDHTFEWFERDVVPQKNLDILLYHEGNFLILNHIKMEKVCIFYDRITSTLHFFVYHLFKRIKHIIFQLLFFEQNKRKKSIEMHFAEIKGFLYATP